MDSDTAGCVIATASACDPTDQPKFLRGGDTPEHLTHLERWSTVASTDWDACPRYQGGDRERHGYKTWPGLVARVLRGVAARAGGRGSRVRPLAGGGVRPHRGRLDVLNGREPALGRGP